MADLICTGITSLDGYIEDTSGSFDWSAPDEEVHRFVNDLERATGTHLYGRRLYEVMAYWEDPPPESDPVELDYAAVWQAADKIVYSTTLDEVSTARTRIERAFEPAAVAELKRKADKDLAIGGAAMAAQAFHAGLIDEVRLLMSPVVVGGGKKFLPDGARLDLDLADERRFGNGVVYLRYRVRTSSTPPR